MTSITSDKENLFHQTTHIKAFMSGNKSQEYDIIMKFWFPNSKYNSKWFNSTPSFDKEIEDKFEGLLLIAEDGKLEHWKTSINGKVALIILFDQFTRNIYRDSNKEVSTRNDAKALELSMEIINDNSDLELPFNMKYFVLLPLRHTKEMKYMHIIFERLDKYNKKISNKDDSMLYEKMLQASQIAINSIKSNIITHVPDNNNKTVLIDEKFKYIMDDIFKFKMIDHYSLVNIDKHPLYDSIYKYCKKHKNIAVSLSGGVDSMVLLVILQSLRLKGHIYKIYTIHINYSNRKETDDEENFLIFYCNYMNIILVTQRIWYMSRTGGGNALQNNQIETNRNFYEIETKKIKFDLYKYCMAYDITGVCMGHHRDDGSENVFSNIMHGRNLLELNVMQYEGLLNGVHIVRPMLDHVKEEVMNIAIEYNIPFFKDTTPLWSNRGKLRKRVFKEIEDIYGPAYTNHLHQLGQESKEWNNVINDFILVPFFNKVKIGKLGCYFPIEEMKKFPKTVTNILLLKIFHKMNHNMITTKCIADFIQYLERNNETTFIKFSNNSFGTLNNNMLFIFSSCLFDNTNKQLLKIQEIKHEDKIGKWKIEIEPTIQNIEKRISYMDIINGEYTYTEINDNGKLFSVKNFDKRDTTRKVFSSISTPVRDYIPMITCGLTNVSSDRITKLINFVGYYIPIILPKKSVHKIKISYVGV